MHTCCRNSSQSHGLDALASISVGGLANALPVRCGAKLVDRPRAQRGGRRGHCLHYRRRDCDCRPSDALGPIQSSLRAVRHCHSSLVSGWLNVGLDPGGAAVRGGAHTRFVVGDGGVSVLCSWELQKPSKSAKSWVCEPVRSNARAQP